MKKISILFLTFMALVSTDVFAQCSVIGEPGSFAPTVDPVAITVSCDQGAIDFTLPNVAAELDPGIYLAGANDGTAGTPVDPVTFPDILAVPGFDIYAVSPSLGDYYVGTEYGPALGDGDGLISGALLNPSCDPEDQTFYALPIIDIYEFDQVANALGAFLNTFVGDDVANPECGQAPITGQVTVNPVLTAQLVSEDAAGCGDLVAALFDANGNQCAGTEQTVSCGADGDTPTASFAADANGCYAAQDVVGTACSGCTTTTPCEAATPISCGETVAGTNIGAVGDADADALGSCGTTPGAVGAWFTFVGTGDDVVFSTCDDADFDTKINIYSGGCGAALVCEGGNDDGTGCGGFTSQTAPITSVAGTTYLVYVTGFGTDEGNFNLTLTCTPPPTPCTPGVANNTGVDCSTAIDICGECSVSGTNVGNGPASDFCAVPACTGADGASASWLTFVGDGGTYTFNTNGSDFDTQLAVFTDDGAGCFTCVDGDDDGGSSIQSAVTITTIAGTTYFIVLDGFGTASGNWILSVTDGSAIDGEGNAVNIPCPSAPASCPAVTPPSITTGIDDPNTPSIADPCGCGNPLNVDLDGDQATSADNYFHEIITIQSSTGTIVIDGQSGFFDNSGNAITLLASDFVNIGDTDGNGQDEFQAVVWHLEGTGYTFDVTVDGEALNLSNSCNACPATDIPTLSEWGLITLALMLLSYGSIAMAGAGKLAGSNNMQLPVGFNIPVNAAILRKAFAFTAILAIMGYACSIIFFGTIFFSDIVGVAIAGPVFAYLAHLLYMIEKKNK